MERGAKAKEEIWKIIGRQNEERTYKRKAEKEDKKKECKTRTMG
jgi:hypothetical protein